MLLFCIVLIVVSAYGNERSFILTGRSENMEEGRNWDAWRPAMNGAKVSLQIVNNGDGTVDIKALMHGTDGVDYIQDYIGINTVDPDNFYFRFTVDNSYLVFE